MSEGPAMSEPQYVVAMRAEIARLRALLDNQDTALLLAHNAMKAEVERLTRFSAEQTAKLSFAVDHAAKADDVVRAAERVSKHLDNLKVWTDELTEFPHKEAQELKDAVAAFRGRA